MTRLQARPLPHHTGWKYVLGLAALLALVPLALLYADPRAWPYAAGYGVLLVALFLFFHAGRVEVAVEPEDVALLQRRGLRSHQVRLRRAPEVVLAGRRDDAVSLVELTVRGPDTQTVTLPLLRLGRAPASQSPELLRALGDGLARSTRRRSTEAAALLHAQAVHTGSLEASPLARLLPPPAPAGGSGGGWSDVFDLLAWLP